MDAKTDKGYRVDVYLNGEWRPAHRVPKVFDTPQEAWIAAKAQYPLTVFYQSKGVTGLRVMELALARTEQGDQCGS